MAFSIISSDVVLQPLIILLSFHSACGLDVSKSNTHTFFCIRCVATYDEINPIESQSTHWIQDLVAPKDYATKLIFFVG